MSTLFAQRLKEERRHNGFTQPQMAQLLGIPFNTYKNYESVGKRNRAPDIDMIVKIATVLKTTTDYLMGKDPV